MLEEHLLLPPAQRPRAAPVELRNCRLSELCFHHLLHSCFFQSKLFPALLNAHRVVVLSVHWMRWQNTADITSILHPDLTELHKRQKSVVSVFPDIVKYSPSQFGMRCLFCSAGVLRHSHNIYPKFKLYYLLEIAIAKNKTNKCSPNCCNPWGRKHNGAENWWIGLTFWTPGSFSSVHLLGLTGHFIGDKVSLSVSCNNTSVLRTCELLLINPVVIIWSVLQCVVLANVPLLCEICTHPSEWEHELLWTVAKLSQVNAWNWGLGFSPHP